MWQVAAILGSASLSLALHSKLCCPLANLPWNQRSIGGWSVRPIAVHKSTLSRRDIGRGTVGDALLMSGPLDKKEQPEDCHSLEKLERAPPGVCGCSDTGKVTS